MKCVAILTLPCFLPPQVHYPPYLFECFLFAPVFDKNSAVQIGNGIVLFKLEKQQSVMWEQLNNPDAGNSCLSLFKHNRLYINVIASDYIHYLNEYSF